MARAGPIARVARISGEFHGVMMPTTPSGIRRGDILLVRIQARRQNAARLAAERSRFQELAGAYLNLPLSLRPYRTRLPDELIGEFVGVYEQQSRDLSQHVATTRARQLGPMLLRLTRRGRGG
jgi:hypothetical protein